MRTEDNLKPKFFSILLRYSIAFFMLEMIIRLYFPVLPSQMVFIQSETVTLRKNLDAKEPPKLSNILFERKSSVFREQAKEGYTIWFVGDSITHGFGVQEREAFDFLLVHQLKKQGVEITQHLNRSSPGLGITEVIETIEQLEREATPNHIVYLMFADDAFSHKMVNIKNQKILFTSSLSNPVGRWLIRNSYLCNLIWKSLAKGKQNTATNPIVPSIDSLHPKMKKLQELQNRIQRQGAQLDIFLLAPMEIDNPKCQNLVVMADMLQEALNENGVQAVYFRNIFPFGQYRIPSEYEATCPIHPNAEGHQELAKKIYSYWKKTGKWGELQ